MERIKKYRIWFHAASEIKGKIIIMTRDTSYA